MNPQTAFCPNLECPAREQRGRDNIRVHSRMEQRYHCDVCERTFCAWVGTVFYRLRTPPETVLMVLALLVYRCPLQAIVKVFGFDERTVKSWWQRAGTHCERVHEQLIGQAQLDLGQVHTDEIKVKAQGQSVWMALALMVPTCLWLGGALSHRRDQALIERLVAQVRAVALHRPLLLAVDGFASDVSAFEAAFRTKLPRFGQRGRCRWRAWSDISIVQVVKRRVVGNLQIERRVVRGCLSEVQRLLTASQGGGTINTAFIERLNATFRQRLSWLTRRTFVEQHPAIVARRARQTQRLTRTHRRALKSRGVRQGAAQDWVCGLGIRERTRKRSWGSSRRGGFSAPGNGCTS